MIPDVLAQAESPALQARTSMTVAEASALVVADATSYERAGGALRGLTDLEREIEAFFEPLTRQAHELHKALTSRRRTFLEPVQTACARLRRAMGDWKAEQDRQRREREREAAEALQQQEQERLMREAALLERQGAAPLAAAVLEEAVTIPAPPVVLPSTTPVVAGVSYQTAWRHRVINPRLVPREFLVVDEAKLASYARAMKAGARVPGVEFYSEQVPVVRGRR